ncbi:uncharacterized protein RCO7_00631 [Rhynchosporium graminicola]|uniref:Uncharacterized protein n=1 Tax=Rhynchosporium graminicola TaxID=2792576 RepID=A0A1E1KN41_9HELO|nr:uncharacterized protein RCO7_00631 [Rhynchosporium commune]
MQNYRNFMPTLNNHQLQVLRESQNAAQDIEKNLLVATSSTPTRTRELAQAQSFRRIMVSTTETVASFIEAKQRQLEADYAFKQAERNFLKEALDQKVISKAQFEDTIKEIPSQKAVDEVQDQLVVLRGDRKFVEDDMRDRELQKEEFEQGYMSLMIQKVESAQAQKSKQGAISKQLIFRKAVLDSGGEAIASSPTNALLLHETIEKALDACEIVFFPEIKGKDTIWRTYVIDTSPKNMTEMITQTFKWADLHLKPLQFLKDNRPAKRFFILPFCGHLPGPATKKCGHVMGQRDLIERVSMGHARTIS